jgi:coenzyme F420-reducing hydrogenase beta subunit
MLDAALKTFIGYSNDGTVRSNGSSGGIGTEIFRVLLQKNLVDAVIGVEMNEKDPLKPRYTLIKDTKELKRLSGSKYVYMPLKELKALIEAHKDLRLAVICPPCFSSYVKKNYAHTKYLISFFCGYNKSYDATEYLIQKTGIPAKNIQRINYRGGEYPGGFTVHAKDGKIKSLKKENYELVDLMFLRKGCHECGFFICDTADIVIGDAWLNQLKNATAIVINSKKGDALIRTLFDERAVTLFGLTKAAIKRMHAHNIRYKTEGHSKIMKFLVRFFGSTAAKKFVPFHLMGLLSKIRRFFKVGIDIPLQKVENY